MTSSSPRSERKKKERVSNFMSSLDKTVDTACNNLTFALFANTLGTLLDDGQRETFQKGTELMRARAKNAVTNMITDNQIVEKLVALDDLEAAFRKKRAQGRAWRPLALPDQDTRVYRVTEKMAYADKLRAAIEKETAETRALAGRVGKERKTLLNRKEHWNGKIEQLSNIAAQSREQCE